MPESSEKLPIQDLMTETIKLTAQLTSTHRQSHCLSKYQLEAMNEDNVITSIYNSPSIKYNHSCLINVLKIK
jgi:DNA-directed RNA polymerase alpha subunit